MKIITYFDNADERGKGLILDILACAVTFGDAFFEEMQEPTDKGDKDGVRAILAKYTAILKERATA